jgi:hypothetical protein
LDSLPYHKVTIATISGSDVGEGTVSPSSLTFAVGNWNAPQTVTVTGVDDDQVDMIPDVDYTIQTSAFTSSDTNFHGEAVADVSVTNTDRKLLP